MNVWKLIAHHEDPERMAHWSEESGRIAVGWGAIGDLRELQCASASEIGDRVAESYPHLANRQTGGPSLWNFFSRMTIGDRVLVAGGGTRFHVAEITGPYVWTSSIDAFDGYQHQRAAVVTGDDPEEFWSTVGESVAPGENSRWTVAMCSAESTTSTQVRSAGFSEGSRYDIISTGVERSVVARRACVAHHGCRCMVCGLDFGTVYGDIGEGFIHVHHQTPLAESQGPREVDPVADLVPLCPNCHAMAHRRRPPVEIDELRNEYRGHQYQSWD